MTISNQAILDYIAAHPDARREDIRRQVAPDTSETTVWRSLKRLVDEDKLEISRTAFWSILPWPAGCDACRLVLPIQASGPLTTSSR